MQHRDDLSGETNKSACILQGPFGRASVNFTRRALVAHAHAQYQFLFKLGGSDSYFRIGDAPHVLSDGGAILINPWESHSKTDSTNNPSVVLSLVIEVDWLGSALELPLSRETRIFPSSSVICTPDVRHHVDRLSAAIANPSVAGQEASQAILQDLLRAVVRDFANPALTMCFRSSGKSADFRIRKALDYISANVEANPSVATVAAYVGMSRSRFFEQFKNCVGIPPQHYIDWTRMSAAIKLLTSTTRPLIDIALELGFEEHSHFTRFFTQHMAVPPSEFRRNSIVVETRRLASAV
jgi:AraC family transcriptional regulator